MLDLGSIALVLMLCALLSTLSYWFGLLSASGATASFIMGIIIGSLGSVGWLVTLLAFTFLGFFVTKFQFQKKKRLNVQEGVGGERTHVNVLANGLVPASIAVISFIVGAQGSEIAGIAFISSVAVAAADTTASELGVMSKKVYLITTGEKVPAGTDGGISWIGTVSCIGASIIASMIGWIAIFQLSPFNLIIMIPITMGIIGCMLDSVIGATLENWGMITKLGNNMITMAIGALMSIIAYLLFI
ncbi:MAG: DUF92 domain-containing protein [Euryarchaeota archaeon]|nr:DUF92 domain-containing protein [Euryarchaeota archaeon]